MVVSKQQLTFPLSGFHCSLTVLLCNQLAGIHSLAARTLASKSTQHCTRVKQWRYSRVGRPVDEQSLLAAPTATNLYCSIDLYRNEPNCTRPSHCCSGRNDARTLTPPSLAASPPPDSVNTAVLRHSASSAASQAQQRT